MNEYAQRLVDGARHLFEGGKGGGAGGSNDGGGQQLARNLTAEEFGKHVEKIASGKMKVTVE